MNSPAPECPACASALRPLYRTAFAGEPWMFRCPACAFCRVEPLPAQFGAAYEDGYTAGPEAERKNRRLAPDYLRKIRRYLPTTPFRFLEIGGAHGWLAQRVRETTGAEVLLLEPGRSAVAAAQARGLPAQLGSLEEFTAKQPFDIVCAAHVIEHVADVAAFLDACGRALPPGGRLLLLTPNAKSWKFALFRDGWAWAAPEEHTLFLSDDAAMRLLAPRGFALEAILGRRPAFAHYPFFLARWLAQWRIRHGLPWVRWITRPLALVEFAILVTLDQFWGASRADELLIVARRI